MKIIKTPYFLNRNMIKPIVDSIKISIKNKSTTPGAKFRSLLVISSKNRDFSTFSLTAAQRNHGQGESRVAGVRGEENPEETQGFRKKSQRERRKEHLWGQKHRFFIEFFCTFIDFVVISLSFIAFSMDFIEFYCNFIDFIAFSLGFIAFIWVLLYFIESYCIFFDLNGILLCFL